MTDLTKTKIDQILITKIDEIWREVEASSRWSGIYKLADPVEEHTATSQTDPGASPYSSHSASSSANLRRKSASKTQQGKGIDQNIALTGVKSFSRV